MNSIRSAMTAFWPALIGVLAAHQVAYAGHDDGHLHGYLETLGPALVVAAVIGWIWSWARARLRLGPVLAIQVLMFAAMESAERLAAGSSFALADLAPIALAVALIPLAAALTIIADGALDLRSAQSPAGVMSDFVVLTIGEPAGSVHAGNSADWSIRAPPASV